MKSKISHTALIAICIVVLSTMAPTDAYAAGNGSYSENVSVETDATYYYCAQGQKFKIVITVKTEEPYEVGEHKYIGYLAFLHNGWQQVKAWNIDGGVVQYTFTLDSKDFAAYYDKSYLFFTASVFPIDQFVEGASLYDKNFQVKFIKPSFDVTFDANGGQCGESSGKAIYNLAYGTLPVPERTGYTFKGWHTSASGGTQITADTIVSEMSNHTLYAQWQPNTYTVILNANGGVCDPLSVSAVYGQKYSNLSNVSVEPPQGKRFAGWYTSASGGTKVESGSTVSIAADHTLYAQWKDIIFGPPEDPDEYTILYNANGGTGAPSAQTKIDGKNLTLSSVTPTREGYDFLGWSESKTASAATYKAGGSYISNGDATLYAVWKERPNGNGNQSQGSNASKGEDKQTNGQTGKLAQTISADSKTLTYKGKSASLNAKTSGDGKLSYSSSNKKVVTVSAAGIIAPKECGDAKITIKAAETDRCEAAIKTITVKVLPKKPVLKLKWLGRSKLKLSWSTVPGASGYKVYSYNAKKKKYAWAITKRAKQRSAVHGNLKKGRTYQYKVRAYRKVGKKVVYGPYSNVAKARR